jgi:hypothetical protein
MADMNAMPPAEPSAMPPDGAPPAEGEATSDDLVTLIATVAQEVVKAMFQDPEFLDMARKALEAKEGSSEMAESPEMDGEDPMAGLDELDVEDEMM